MDQLLNFFISSAHADTAANAAQQGGGFSFMFIFALFFVFIYFAMWRPQSKRAKEVRDLIASLAKGDEVMTEGGLLGKVTKITDQYVALTIANNVEIVLRKSAVVGVMPKGTLKSIE